MTVAIRDFQIADGPALLAIYNDEIRHGSATFEETPLTLTVLTDRLAVIAEEFPLLVLEHHGKVVGYCYANHYKPRSAYRFCVETTIYLAKSVHGKGLGKQLYQALFQRLATQGIEQAIAIVTHPNVASERFHQRLGFTQVGLLQQVGYKFERWYDVALYQCRISQQKS